MTDVAVGHQFTPYITVYSWSDGVGFGTKYSNPSTLPSYHCYGVWFCDNPATEIMVACEQSPFIYAYAFTPGVGFGAKYANPGTLPDQSVHDVCMYLTQDVLMPCENVANCAAYPWVSGSGFGTKYSAPATPPTGTGLGIAMDWGSNVVSISHTVTPYLSNYPWITGSGFGVKYTNPSPGFSGSSQINDVGFCGDSAVGGAGPLGSYCDIWDWDNVDGFGTRYTAPAGLPGNGNTVQWMSDQTAVAVGHLNSPFVSAYPWDSSTGVGTKYTNPSTLPPQTVYEITQYHSTDVALGHGTTPFASGYSWTPGTGWGTKYSNPGTLPTGSGLGISFSETPLEPACPMPAMTTCTPYIPVELWYRFAGRADSTSASKLVDSTAAFSSWGVQAGWIVRNRTDGTYTTVSAVDSETQLSINSDIFESGEFYTIEYQYADLTNVIEIRDWQERAFGAKATVECHNAGGTYDSYDSRNMFIRIYRGYYYDYTYYKNTDVQFMKVIEHDWTSQPNNPKDTYIMYCKGLWEILSNYKLPVDMYFNQSGLNDDTSIDDMTAKQMINYVLCLAGLSLGTDIDTMTTEYINTAKPQMSFAAGTPGSYIVVSILALFQASLTCRQDKMHLFKDDNGKSYEYRCPTNASYLSFVGGNLRESLPDVLKAEVYSSDAVYASGAWTATYDGSYASTDPAWTPDMGKLVWIDTYGIVTSDAIAAHIAQAVVERSVSKVEASTIYMPIMDVCQEPYTETTIVDGRGNITGVGLSGVCSFHYSTNNHPTGKKPVYSLTLTLGSMRPTDYINNSGLGLGGSIPADEIIGTPKIKNMTFSPETELTIDASGAITVTQTRHTVDTNADAASDNLDTINGGDTTNLVILRAENGARTVVVRHNQDNIWLQGQVDISLDDLEDSILLVWDAENSKWFDFQTPHKDSHDPNDGADPLDTAAASEIAGVQAAATGTSHSLARSDHAHQIQHGITDNHLLTVDDAAAANDDICFFTANGIEGWPVCGSTFPTTPPDGFMFTHETTGRKILYCYDADNTTWKPIMSIGMMTVYVDKTDGTDDMTHGTGVNSDAFASIQYAVNMIPGLVGGNIVININDEDYDETVTIRGKQITGNYAIYLYGTLSSLEVESNATVAAGSGAVHGTVSGTLDADYSNKLAYFATDDEYRMVDSNSFTLGYDAGDNEPAAGDIITGDASNAVATVISVTVDGGDWATNDAAGTMELHVTYGTFQDDETITNETQSNALATVDTAAGNAANNNIVLLVGTAPSSTSQDVTFYDWGTSINKVEVRDGQQGVYLYDLKLDGGGSTYGFYRNNYSYTLIFRCNIDSGGYYAGYLRDGYTEFYYCYIEADTHVIYVEAGWFRCYGSKLNSTTDNDRAIWTLNNSLSIIGQGSVIDATSQTGTRGIYSESGSQVSTYTVAADGYLKIRNQNIGCYAKNGAQITNTSTNLYSGNGTNESVTAASYGYID